MSLLQNSNAISAGGYDVNNSLRFRSNASAASTAYLTRTPASNTNRTTWTWSAWVKRAFLSSSGETTLFGAAINSGDRILISFYQDKLLMYAVSGGVASTVSSAAVYRDPSAWYHVVVAMDTTQATASNRSRLYINGTEITSFATSTRPNQNQTFAINSTNEHQIGRNFDGTSQVNFMDGYLAEVNFIDGQALTPSSFGETDAVTGSWVAKKYTGTYGTNGFYLPFSDTETNENLLTYSEQFDNAAWVKTNVTVTANTVASPLSGAVTADSLYETTANAEHFLEYVVTNPLTVTEHTFSCYAKYINRRYIRLRTVYQGGPSDTSVTYDLIDGVVVESAALYATITSVGGGWYRLSMTTKTSNPNPVSNWLHRIHCENDTYTGVYAGDASKGYYIFGAQVSYGTTTKNYIATTSSAITPRGTTENLHTYSEQFDNAGWTKGASTVTANSVVAPNGTTTADTLIDNTTSDQHLIVQAIATPVIGDIYTMSIYAKANTRSQIGLTMHGEAAASFDLTAGTVLSSGGLSNVGIQSMGNGWYRCYVTITKTNTNPNVYYIIYKDGVNPYLGTGTGSIYIWGAQISREYTLGPYLPTVASTQSFVYRLGADKSLGATSFGYNSWISNNISMTPGSNYDAMLDSPTLTSATVANYATLNPLSMNGGTTTLSNANLTFTSTSAAHSRKASTIGVTSGKWYAEVTLTAKGGDFPVTGIVGTTVDNGNNFIGSDTSSYGYASNGQIFTNGASVAYGATYTTGDIIGIIYDADNGKLYFSKNGTIQNSGNPSAGTGFAYSGLSGQFLIGCSGLSSTVWNINFGQRPFSYTPPTGYVALNTYNLPDNTILKGNRYMDATLYTGTLATLNINNNAGFSPSLVWIKSRSAAGNTNVYDAVRGATLELETNFTNAEATVSNGLTSFNSNGFTLGNNAGVNASGTTYVAWQWQAGQGTNTTNTAGSITSTVSVNATAGFSVVTFTSQASGTGTVGHGLGIEPSLIITKLRTLSANWRSYHSSLGATKDVRLNLTDAALTTNTSWADTEPTSTVFTVGSSFAGSYTTVAYCWAAIPGFSRFGSYTGNGSANGPFVYLGFRPKFVMFKRTDSTSDWVVEDSSRSTYNQTAASLYPNLSNVETTAYPYDLLSNGFKVRDTPINVNGGTYIYMAFAENPFKNANAR